jgi:hypothetical protein
VPNYVPLRRRNAVIEIANASPAEYGEIPEEYKNDPELWFAI